MLPICLWGAKRSSKLKILYSILCSIQSGIDKLENFFAMNEDLISLAILQLVIICYYSKRGLGTWCFIAKGSCQKICFYKNTKGLSMYICATLLLFMLFAFTSTLFIAYATWRCTYCTGITVLAALLSLSLSAYPVLRFSLTEQCNKKYKYCKYKLSKNSESEPVQ